MTLPEILLLAVALAMDAFAVSLGLGTAAAGDKIRACWLPDFILASSRGSCRCWDTA